MNPILTRDRSTGKYAWILFAVTTLLFVYSVWIRQPWFGHLSEPTIFPKIAWHQWSTGSTVKFARMWYEEGPIRLKFAMLEEPGSVEFPSLADRDPYVSYPPGTVLTIYLLARLSGYPPSPALVMGYNLFCQYAIALLLGWIVLLVLSRYRDSAFPVWVYALLPPMVYLLTPTLLFYHQQVFFADQAVLLPFVLILFTETLRDGRKTGQSGRALAGFQMFLLLYGSLTDWLFICVAACLWMKRVFENDKTPVVHRFLYPTLTVGVPVLVAMGLFVWQILSIEQASTLAERFLIRVGTRPEQIGTLISDTPDTRPFLIRFFLGVLSEGTIPFVATIVLVIPVALLSLKLRFDRPQTLPVGSIFSVSWLSFAPCLLHVVILREHSAHHAFSAQKFWIPLSLVTFSLLPFLAIELMSCWRRNKALLPDRISRPLNTGYLHLAPILLALVFLAIYFPRFSRQFSPKSSDLPVLQGIFDTIEYDDIVFSPNCHIYANPPQVMAYAMKRVYWTQTIPEVKAWLQQHRSIHPDIVLLFRDKIPDVWKPIVSRYKLVTMKNYYLVHIDRTRLPEEFAL